MQASQSRGILLEVGDPHGPHGRPASFTTFALPFIWSLSKKGKPGASHVYRALPAVEEHRGYFTPETACALFDRARWYRLEKNTRAAAIDRTDQGNESARVDGEHVVHIDGRDIEISIAPPRIVLFEAAAGVRCDPTAATGFLLIDVHFPASPANGIRPTLDDLLQINELFRYWRRPFGGHEAKYRSVMGDLDPRIASHGDYLSRWSRLLLFPVETEQGLQQLLAPRALEKAAEWCESATGPRRGWIAYTDNRAFVWTCVQTEGGARNLWGIWRSRDPKFSGEWVRLLNVDPPSREETTDFERQWVKERTYERWKHLGTLYGFNTHAGAMLAEPRSEPPLWQHFGGLYFNQMLLLLYLRVTTFRFSEELAKVSGDLLSRPRDKNVFREFRRLRRAFAFLTNLYRFPLISSQQQGIEMYAYARKSLDIDALFTEVQTEIESTHEMFELVSTQKMAQVTADLTVFVIFAGAVATVAALLAADDLDGKKMATPLLRLVHAHLLWMPSWWVLAFSLILVGLFGFTVWWRQRD